MMPSTDPKNREEMDAYIRQLEGEGNVPEGMTIPEEGLCVKVSVAHSRLWHTPMWLREPNFVASPTGVDEEHGEP